MSGAEYFKGCFLDTELLATPAFDSPPAQIMSQHVEAFLEENSDLTVGTITASHLWPLLQKLEEESGGTKTAGLGRQANILCVSLRQNYNSSMGLAERLRHLCTALYVPSKRSANNNNELLVSLELSCERGEWCMALYFEWVGVQLYSHGKMLSVLRCARMWRVGLI